MRTRKPAIAAVATSCLALILTGCGTPADNGTETQDATPAASPTVEEPASGPEEAETAQTPETTEDETSSSEEDGGGADDLAEFTPEAQTTDNWEEDFVADFSHTTRQVLSDIRHGVHEGYERVVLEYSEGTDLASRAEYQEPSDDSDAPPASLLVEILGTTGGRESEELALTQPWHADSEEHAVWLVEPLALEGGESELRIGLDQERPFRLHHAEEPTRIIIDIAH